MNKDFSDDAWDEYLFWIAQDKKTLKKINNLLKDIERNGNSGLGKPESLKGDFSGYWSREIDEKNRLVYKIDGNIIKIIQCKNHYNDK
jgi:toxin YoeB